MQRVMNDSKSILRNRFKKQRQALYPEERDQKNHQIQETLENLDEFKNAKKILVYISKPDEVGTHELIQRNLDKKEIWVPQIDAKTKTLKAFRLKEWTQLTPGAFGVLEINEEDASECPLVDAELILVPGLAFDTRGHRLGYGKGYYDQLLASTQAYAIGLAYECQLLPQIPIESYDRPVQKIVTEKRILNPTP